MRSTVELSDGTQMPIVGIGTGGYRTREDAVAALGSAIRLGHRLVDTAAVYKDLPFLGEALRPFQRSDLYLTSKVNADALTGGLPEAFARITGFLETDYLDLLMIHAPKGVDLPATLAGMTALQQQGKLRSIGVSNCEPRHLEAIASTGIRVTVNQVELHPYLAQRRLADYCGSRGIQLVAYRPLCRGEVEKDAVLGEIGAGLGKTASQIALRWLVQRGIPFVSFARTESHQRQNLELFDFELSAAAVAKIDALDRNHRTCAGPAWADFD